MKMEPALGVAMNMDFKDVQRITSVVINVTLLDTFQNAAQKGNEYWQDKLLGEKIGQE